MTQACYINGCDRTGTTRVNGYMVCLPCSRAMANGQPVPAVMSTYKRPVKPEWVPQDDLDAAIEATELVYTDEIPEELEATTEPVSAPKLIGVEQVRSLILDRLAAGPRTPAELAGPGEAVRSTRDKALRGLTIEGRIIGSGAGPSRMYRLAGAPFPEKALKASEPSLEARLVSTGTELQEAREQLERSQARVRELEKDQDRMYDLLEEAIGKRPYDIFDGVKEAGELIEELREAKDQLKRLREYEQILETCDTPVGYLSGPPQLMYIVGQWRQLGDPSGKHYRAWLFSDEIRCAILDAGHPLGDDSDPELTPRRLVRELVARFSSLREENRRARISLEGVLGAVPDDLPSGIEAVCDLVEQLRGKVDVLDDLHSTLGAGPVEASMSKGYVVEPISVEGESCYVVVDGDTGEELGDDTGAVYYLDPEVAQQSAECGAPLIQISACPCGWRGHYPEKTGACPRCGGRDFHCTDQWEQRRPKEGCGHVGEDGCCLLDGPHSPECHLGVTCPADDDDWEVAVFMTAFFGLACSNDSDDGLDDYYSLIDEDDDPPHSTWLEVLDDSSGTLLTVPDLEHQVERLQEELSEARDQRDLHQASADNYATLAQAIATDLGCDDTPGAILSAVLSLQVHRARLLALVRTLEPMLGGSLATKAHELVLQQAEVNATQPHLVQAIAVARAALSDGYQYRGILELVRALIRNRGLVVYPEVTYPYLTDTEPSPVYGGGR